ncbi:hypothetical protein Tco_1300760 [Tanacetum coccineum]
MINDSHFQTIKTGHVRYFPIFGKLEESCFPFIVLSHKVNIEKALDLFLKGESCGSMMAKLPVADLQYAIDGVLRGAIGCGPPPKPCERFGSSSVPALFKPASAGSTSDVV